jgi:hypothetical protein
VAKVFAAIRVTGQVSNGVARDLLARLQSFTDACDAVGVEVKQTVDARLDPEPVVAEPSVSEALAGLGGSEIELPTPEEIAKLPAVKVVIRKPARGAK